MEMTVMVVLTPMGVAALMMMVSVMVSCLCRLF